MTRFRTIPTTTSVQGIEHFPDLLSPDTLRQSPVFLISADLPCCGSSTIAGEIGRQVTRLGFKLEAVNVGERIREKLNVKNEVELGRALSAVDDPTVFDPEIYGNLPQDKVCVVDGKLATTAGPFYISPDRPVFSVDLTSNLLTSAKRNFGREGTQLTSLLTQDASKLLSRVALLSTRAAHDNGMRHLIMAASEKGIDDEPTLPLSYEGSADETRGETNAVTSIQVNTNSMCRGEILEYFSGDPKRFRFDDYVPEWEVTALRETLATLSYLRVQFDEKTHQSDRQHFEFHYDSARYGIERLKTTLHPSGIKAIRQDIKKALVDCWFGLMMKQVPRFFENAAGDISLDEVSHAWTPEYYKVAEAWPVLKTILKGKRILDPFGGAGTLVNLLAARDIVQSARLSDISYRGGVPVDHHGHTYSTQLNAEMSRVLFDELPSWYKPNLDIIEDRVSANARQLPFTDRSFDYIVTDPPYGKNHDSGGIGLTIGCLPEFERVTRKGTIMMMPMRSATNKTDWASEIKSAGYPVQILTSDVSRGRSGWPVCYARIDHRVKK